MITEELCSNLMFQLGKTGAHEEAQETPVINDLTMVIGNSLYDVLGYNTHKYYTGLKESAGTLLQFKVLVDAECTHDGSIKHIQKFENWGWTTLERRVLNAERTDDLTVLQ
ncbi:hypothetical protein Tco_0049546, partial [Tanacetum coccineum]